MDEGVTGEVRAAGGEIFAISSEPQTLAGRATSEWRLDFAAVGDPHHEISGACRERGWLDLFVNERMDFLRRSAAARDLDWAPTHPKGYFQPGVIALARDGRVLYRWRSIPNRRNVGGAASRPPAGHVWARIREALDVDAPSSDAPLDEAPPVDSRGLPWVIFAPLLVANGWFVQPRGFRSYRAIGMAAVRLVAFVAAWIAAFASLPTWPVAAALAGWVAFITPKVRWLGREFQNAEAPPAA